MTRFGYTLMTEQAGPKELVRYAQEAERHGFDFEVCSDHYFPWLDSMGHSPYAWAVLGAAAHATRRIGLMSYVTCPTMRYHPAVVAQKAATLGLLSDGRFTLGVGAGENLNEHVVGERWPAVAERHEMLEEALVIMRDLLDGEQVTFVGDHFRVDQAKLWDRPEEPLEIGVAASGSESVSRFSELGDHLINTEPNADLVASWQEGRREAGLPESRVIGQIPVSWGPDPDEALRRAHELFRWSGMGWHVNADLPTTTAFQAATSFVRPEDVAQSVACGPDLDAIVEKVRPYWEAGFTDIALVQIGGDSQEAFLADAAEPLLEKLRSASASG
ncbi:LLM class F420-dependent oxidoreductase [Georgenia halophila]|uniref:LLM class F420-dependent oxidoreductase n=1 Tax=Georgenia halophila TaxID=620889 RepID=A0ABP8LJQ5_9MICO